MILILILMMMMMMMMEASSRHHSRSFTRGCKWCDLRDGRGELRGWRGEDKGRERGSR